ncbi:capsid assembly scaffolding protein [Phage DSL-LC06]|nr:capsid assembly scaffolding protein [Phage DSL-LC06]
MNAENAAVNDSQATVPETNVEQQVDTESSKETLLSQDDVNRIIAERVARERAKFEKKYSNVDLDLYNQLIEKQEQQRKQELEKRGEFEKLLKEQAEKFQGRIQQYESELHSIKVDGALLNEASNQRSINPNQVVSLLKSQIRLNEAGQVDVIDADGNVRYTDNGTPLTVSALVNEFLTANPHFKAAGPSGTGTGSGVGRQQPVVDNDISKLDMNNPEHRARYAQIMRAKGIRI